MECHKRNDRKISPSLFLPYLLGSVVNSASTLGDRSSYVANLDTLVSTQNVIAALWPGRVIYVPRLKFRSNLQLGGVFIVARVTLIDHEHPGLLFVAIINFQA